MTIKVYCHCCYRLYIIVQFVHVQPKSKQQHNKLFKVRKVVREYGNDDELKIKKNIKRTERFLLFLCQHILNGDFSNINKLFLFICF